MMISVIPAYGCTGFLPFFKNGNVKFGGLTSPEELYVLAIYFVSSRYPFDIHSTNEYWSDWSLIIGTGVWYIPRLRTSVLF